jgi:chromatin segregation and condensation protein Rec8/ScpA/Scc1 (kleisin family)
MKRSQAALAFSALMVLLKKEVVDQKQEDPYGPILVRLL